MSHGSAISGLTKTREKLCQQTEGNRYQTKYAEASNVVGVELNSDRGFRKEDAVRITVSIVQSFTTSAFCA